MSLEKDIEEMYSIVQEIKQKEVEILKLRERLKARAEKVPATASAVSSGDVAVGTHKRGRPRKPTVPEPASQIEASGADSEGIDPAEQAKVDAALKQTFGEG
jgi:stress response protein YsnF